MFRRLVGSDAPMLCIALKARLSCALPAVAIGVTAWANRPR